MPCIHWAQQPLWQNLATLKQRLKPDAFPTPAATHTKFHAAPKRARPFPTTCDRSTPSPFPTSPHLRAALALLHRRVRYHREPTYDISRPADACATACDTSHPPNPALTVDCFLAITDGLGYDQRQEPTHMMDRKRPGFEQGGHRS
ncbi:hypothetical protein EDB89DRAFT_1909679 [Lactarius sanguifluus]|nr:hypothetical protein EDB89DRAFT_1909679 [Lactarius sanguifluus]